MTLALSINNLAKGRLIPAWESEILTWPEAAHHPNKDGDDIPIQNRPLHSSYFSKPSNSAKAASTSAWEAAGLSLSRS